MPRHQAIAGDLGRAPPGAGEEVAAPAVARPVRPGGPSGAGGQAGLPDEPAVGGVVPGAGAARIRPRRLRRGEPGAARRRDRGPAARPAGDRRRRRPAVAADHLLRPPDRRATNRPRTRTRSTALPTDALESVLGLFLAQGAPRRMLRWHYRSRHESLIAVSNREFYDGRLIVFPGPTSDRSAPRPDPAPPGRDGVRARPVADQPARGRRRGRRGR